MMFVATDSAGPEVPDTSFLLSSTPLWVTLLSSLISLAAVCITLYVTRNNLILTAPELELSFGTMTHIDGTIPITVTNRGKSDALDVKIVWDFDPLRLHAEGTTWECGRLRPGEAFTGRLRVIDGQVNEEDTMALGMRYNALAEAGKPSSRGWLTYRKHLAIWKRTKKRIALPTEPQIMGTLSDLQSELHAQRAREAGGAG